MIFYLPLVKKEKIAKDTCLFSFDKRKSEIKFISGQHVGIGFNHLIKPDPFGTIKLFSISSTPKDKYLDVVMRMRDSGFKKTLDAVKIGQKVYIEGPYGQFTLHVDNSNPVVFIAGGVGLAPARGIVKDVIDNRRPYKIEVFYSDKTVENSIFLDEFLQWEKDKKIKFFYTLTKAKDSNANTGRINKKVLKENISDFKKPVFYIAGSPDMVFDMKNLLLDLGVKDEKINTEEFAGY